MSDNTTTKNTEWSDREVGALWKRESRNSGQKYLAGHVRYDELGTEKTLKVVVFSNRNKKDGDKTPDFRVYVSKEMPKTSEEREETVETVETADSTEEEQVL
jgi:uncharacterized protein (DUF736 family)